MGKIYKRVRGCVPKLCHIGSGGGCGTRTKRRPNASLNYGDDGGGRYAGGGKGQYGGVNYLGYYIKSNLIIVDLRIGGQPRGGLLFFTINSQPATLKIIKKYLLILINMPVHKLIKWNFTNKKKAEI